MFDIITPFFVKVQAISYTLALPPYLSYSGAMHLRLIWLSFLLASFLLTLAACEDSEAPQTAVATSTIAPLLTPTSTPETTGTPGPGPAETPIPTPQPFPPPAALSGSLTLSEVEGLTHTGLKGALEELSERLGVDPTEIQVLRVEEVAWRDAALGCPAPGGFYAQVLTPGVRVLLAHQGQRFDYHGADSGVTLCPEGQRQDPLEARPLQGVWSILAPVPTARSEVAAVKLNGKLYVLGGFGLGATANEEYDPITNAWRQRASIPQPVNHAAAVALGGKIYLIGGFDGRFRPVNSVWVYDPEVDAWTRRADLPTPRGALGAVVVDGTIYAIGGRGTDGDLTDTDEYDPIADVWRPRAPMPSPRDHLALAVADGRIYAVAGRLGTFARNLDVAEEYDPKTDVWRERAALPTSRSGIAGGTVDGKVYVFGGEAVEGTFDATEWYDPSNDTWSTALPMPTARHGLGAVSLGNRIYVLAGGPTPGGSQSARNEVFIVLASEAP